MESECGTILLNRIRAIDPENTNKIVGYILLTNTKEQIIEYARGTDKQINSLVNEVKFLLLKSSKVSNPIHEHNVLDHNQGSQFQFLPFTSTVSRNLSSPSTFQTKAPYISADHVAVGPGVDISQYYREFASGNCRLHGPTEEFNALGSFGNDMIDNLSANPSSPSITCHYYHKGYCKHGINCRYMHTQGIPDNVSQMCPLSLKDLNEVHAFSLGSLEKLEAEIAELLRERNGLPVSIASLPMLYFERYGKPLQADGYLTESQRHGKAGFSLTKLLERLRRINLIDRPHGQHAVVLAEDATKYVVDCSRGEMVDAATLSSCSHQIYLTFPAESTFSEEDVSDYFRQYGPVRDVRIPRQEKRMFGFVSFLFAETVRHILSKNCPHYICGARVLVKPYKEKSRLADKKYQEKSDLPLYHPTQCLDMEQDAYLMPRVCDSSRVLRRQTEGAQHMLEFQTRRFYELQLASSSFLQQPHMGHSVQGSILQEDKFDHRLISDSSNHGQANQDDSTYGDQDSSFFDLPDSPFASPGVGGNTPTTI